MDYVVKCFIRIKNSDQLIIKPGVKIQFEGPDAGIDIDEQAAIIAEGTAAKPIIMEGKTAVKGSWYGLIIESNNVTNSLKYVTLRHAGSKKEDTWTNVKAGLIVGQYEAGKVAITNCTFEKNDGYGVYLYSQETELTNFSANLFRDNTLAPIEVPLSQVGKLDAPTDYGSTNGRNYVQISPENSNSQYLNVSQTMRKLNVPYRVFGEARAENVLTIEAGTTIEFATDASLKIDEATGGIRAIGTAAEPITFKGANPGKGAWEGIFIDNNNVNNRMDYCVIDGGGSATDIWFSRKSNLYIGQYEKGHLDMSNCQSNNSGGWGICRYATSTGSLNDITYTGNTSGDLYTKP